MDLESIHINKVNTFNGKFTSYLYYTHIYTFLIVIYVLDSLFNFDGMFDWLEIEMYILGHASVLYRSMEAQLYSQGKTGDL